MKNLDLAALLAMSHSGLQNYIVPGLQSRLLGERSDEHGNVRLFVNSRHQHHHITPHSHRFDFQFLVLRGWVNNIVFTRAAGKELNRGDFYTSTSLTYRGKPGEYNVAQLLPEEWVSEANTYSVGEWYGMRHDEVHSIKFSRDAVVLFFEGPQATDQTIILEPCVNGQTLPTFKVEDWMFQQESNGEAMF